MLWSLLAFFSLRSEIVLITFSYWPAFQPAPIYLSTWASANSSALRPLLPDSTLLYPSHLLSANPYCPARCEFSLVLSLKKTSFRHKHFSHLFLVLSKETIDVHTAHFGENYTVCVYPISSCLKLSVKIAPFLTMCLILYFLRKTIEGTNNSVCVCYITLPYS